MKRRSARLLAAAATFSAACAALSCEQIVGIEDRTYTPAKQAVSPLCKQYCEEALSSCTGAFAVYSGSETCHATCALLDEGDLLEPVDGNTVACRMRQAGLARATGEPAEHCPAAGPGGAGVCGDDCESYCGLLEQACPAEHRLVQDCVQKCAGLKDTGAFDVIVDHDGDTLQCRLVHVSSAAVDPAEHCKHAQLLPNTPCTDPQAGAPDCESYCQLNLTACSGELAVYESLEQCLAVCDALPPGENDDATENTIGCRRYHSYSSVAAPQNHCPHTGPGGDGHCGLDTNGRFANCDSYCHLLKAACSTDFSARFTDHEACVADCSSEPPSFGAAEDSGYSVATAQSGATLGCRLLHVSRALSDSSACSAALGGAPCQ